MFDIFEALETVAMVQLEKLDIRTVTLGINLLDIKEKTASALASKVYDRIKKNAKKLVKAVKEVEEKYSIPIVNKRISLTPVSMILDKVEGDWLKVAQAIDEAAEDAGIDFVGGFSVLAEKGLTSFKKEFMEFMPYVFAQTNRLCGSVAAGSTKIGLNIDVVKQSAQIMKSAARLTADKNSIGAAKFVVFANAVSDNPFMAGAFLGPQEPDLVINVGISGPGVVKTTLEMFGKDADLSQLAELIKKVSFKITRAGYLIGQEVAKKLGVKMGIVDLSLAPTPAENDSVAEILEEIGISVVGGPGSTAILAMLTDAVKKGGVMATNVVGGLSGAFIPVSEDANMIKAAESGILTVEKLEAMTAVCSVGLDMVVVPGDVSVENLAGLIADELMIGVVTNKTTACRIIPAYGVNDKGQIYPKKAGEYLDFGGLLGKSPVMPMQNTDCSKFINRGGFIPAPIMSFRN